MTEKDLIDYCKKVDSVLCYWTNERMKQYGSKQYGKGIIQDLMKDNPIRQGDDYGRQCEERDELEGTVDKGVNAVKGSIN